MILDAVIIPEIQSNVAINNYSDDFLQLALLTVIIEVPIFYLCGYRNFNDCLYFAAVNVISNLLLNGFLMSVNFNSYNLSVAIGEIFVVILEFVLCCYWIKADRRRLFKTLIFTNVVSFLIGLIF
ncbi:MAG: hypothetical protein IJ728_13500 [Selenomonadaceae bacterium]|nr:hypothetical protein [Selenomonadaceae bacterium]